MIAVDGKSVRGASDGDGRQPHLVAALDQHTGAVLAQTAVEEKSSEIAAVPVVLGGLDITDAVITADALHTQRGHADYLHARGAHYLLPVKANQPTLLRRLRALPWTAIGRRVSRSTSMVVSLPAMVIKCFFRQLRSDIHTQVGWGRFRSPPSSMTCRMRSS